MARLELKGQTFERWSVLSDAGKSKQGAVIWLCQCNGCGAEAIIAGFNLKRGRLPRCECSRTKWHEGYMSELRAPIVPNAIHGHYRVIRQAPNSKPTKTSRLGVSMVLCECMKCGNEVVVQLEGWKNGRFKQCHKCQLKEAHEAAALANTSHGMSGAPEYRVWAGMIQRCTNSNVDGWETHGSRGITVCDRWLPAAGGSFENFYADMGDRPRDDYHLDRTDNDGPYSPDNCQWVPIRVNMQNRRNTRMVTYNGIEMPLVIAAEMAGLNYATVRNRIDYYGWSEDRALHTPVSSLDKVRAEKRKQTMQSQRPANRKPTRSNSTPPAGPAKILTEFHCIRCKTKVLVVLTADGTVTMEPCVCAREDEAQRAAHLETLTKMNYREVEVL